MLAIPDDYSSSSVTGLSMIDASVGSQLTWTLTSINHILRTVSKYGEQPASNVAIGDCCLLSLQCTLVHLPAAMLGIWHLAAEINLMLAGVGLAFVNAVGCACCQSAGDAPVWFTESALPADDTATQWIVAFVMKLQHHAVA